MTLIRFKFVGDSSSLDRAAKRGKQSLDSMRTGMNQNAAAAAKWGAAVSAAGAVVAATLIRRTMKAVDEQAKLAQQLDTTSASLASLNRAGQLTGVGMRNISVSARTLSVRIGEAQQGLVSAEDAFKAMNLEAADLAALPLDERIIKINEALRENVPASQRAAVAADLFGSRNANAMMMLEPDVIREATAQTEAYGLALSDVDAAKVEMANDAMSEITLAAKGLMQTISVELAPVLKAMAEQFTSAAKESGGFSDDVADAMNSVISAVGFAMDAVEGLKRVFEIAGAVVAGAFAQALANLTTPLKLIMDGMEALAELTGMDLPASLQSASDAIQDFHTTAAGTAQEAIKEISDILNEPMPSEGLQQFVADAREAGQAAAEAAVEARKSGTIQSGGAGEGTDEGASQQELDSLNTKLDAIREANMTEVELERQKMAEKLQVIKDALAEEQITKQEAAALAEETWSAHNEKLTEIERRAAEDKMAIEENLKRSREQAMGQMFGNLRGLMNSENRKMFEVGKAGAIAEATVNTYKAATGAYSALSGIPVVGPALGIAAAAAAVAYGSQQVQSIQSQSFGGGSGPSAAGGGAAAAPPTPAASGTGPDTSNDTFVTLQGISPDSFVRAGSVADMLNEEIENGANIRGVRIAS